MKTLLFVFAMVVMLLLSGCGDLFSVQPLATAETVVFDAGLTGDWSCATEDCTALIRPGSDQKKEYDIVWVPGGADEEVLRLKGQLVRVGDRLVMDLTTAKWPDLTLPEHFFMLVEKTASGVNFHWLDSKWLRSRVASQTGLPFMELPKNALLITGGSTEIRAFLAKFGLDPQAVSDTISLKRVKEL